MNPEQEIQSLENEARFHQVKLLEALYEGRAHENMRNALLSRRDQLAAAVEAARVEQGVEPVEVETHLENLREARESPTTPAPKKARAVDRLDAVEAKQI